MTKVKKAEIMKEPRNRIVQLTVNESLEQAIRALAAKSDTNMAELVRNALFKAHPQLMDYAANPDYRKLVRARDRMNKVRQEIANLADKIGKEL
jgi:hypothetical protein